MEMRHTDAAMHEKAEGKLQISLHYTGSWSLQALSSLLHRWHEKVSDSLWVLFQKRLAPWSSTQVKD